MNPQRRRTALQRRLLASRAGWALANQALSSLTNFALGIAVARSVTTAAFGAFSLAFATYLVVMGVTRAVCAQPVVIRYALSSEERWREGVRRSTGAAVIIGGLAGLGCAVVGAWTDGPFRAAYLALAICLPGLMVQDCWRFAFFAKGDGRSAFVNDLVWAVVLFPPLGLLMARQTLTVFVATLLWGGAATVAALYGVRQSRAVPQPVAVGRWWREHRDIVPAYLGEFGATAGAAQLAMFGVGAAANLVAVGALRAGDIMLGPVRALFSGIRHVAQPEAVRLHAAGPRMPAAAALLSVVLAVVALAVGAVLIFLPEPVGEALLRDTWAPARQVLLPLTLGMAASGLLVGAQMGLHALVAVRRSLGARIWLSIMLIVFQTAGAVVGGARGAAWGAAAALWIGAVLWWAQFRSALAERLEQAGDG